jgi:hypothetical protein
VFHDARVNRTDEFSLSIKNTYDLFMICLRAVEHGDGNLGAVRARVARLAERRRRENRVTL